MKYRQEYDGQWIYPNRKSYKVVCCDCGLVHRMEFRIKKRHIEYRVYRDQRATGQRRRHLKEEPAY